MLLYVLIINEFKYNMGDDIKWAINEFTAYVDSMYIYDFLSLLFDPVLIHFVFHLSLGMNFLRSCQI